MQKKADVARDITTIKNDYVTNASLTSQLNDLKSQHIATEVTAIGNKAKKMQAIFQHSKINQRKKKIL